MVNPFLLTRLDSILKKRFQSGVMPNAGQRGMGPISDNPNPLPSPLPEPIKETLPSDPIPEPPPTPEPPSPIESPPSMSSLAPAPLPPPEAPPAQPPQITAPASLIPTPIPEKPQGAAQDEDDPMDLRFRTAPPPAPPAPVVPDSSVLSFGNNSSNISDNLPNKTDASQRKSDAQNYFEQLERIRNNKGPALTAYQHAIDNQPTPEQYKPSLGRRIGAIASAALTGYGSGDAEKGIRVGREVNDSPYLKAQGMYRTKLGALQESAKLEDISTNKQMSNLEKAQAMGLKWDEFQATREDKAESRKIAQQNADTSSKNVDSEVKYRDATIDEKGKSRVISQQNADTSKKNAASLDEYRKGMLRIHQQTADARDKAGKYITPAQKKIAYDLALREMMSDKNYSRFVKDGDSASAPFVIKPDDSDLFKHFKVDLDKRVKQIIDKPGKAAVGSEEDPFADEFEIGDPIKGR